jgi:hypothetical protein
MALVLDHCPAIFNKILAFYSIIEKIYVFTVKRKLRCTLNTIQTLYITFDTDISSNDNFLKEFRVLNFLCPLGIQISQMLDHDDSNGVHEPYSLQQV